METMKPRRYQHELIERCRDHNVLVTLDTGSGKTLIATELIRDELPSLKAQHKAAVFLAPTNPLVAQQCDVITASGFKAKAYHGNAGTSGVSSWDTNTWTTEWQSLDVLVMTPEVLLHILAHGYMTMARVGLLVFDECHHCSKNHPYNQLMEDFYWPLPPKDKPHILALTASPERMTGTTGLQENLGSVVLTAENREEVAAIVHVPTLRTVPYEQQTLGPITAWAYRQLQQSLELMKTAKQVEKFLTLVQRGQQLLLQEGPQDRGTDMLSGLAPPDGCGSGFEASRLAKQMGDMFTCFGQLGPWAAAAAAYLDMFAPSNAAVAPDLADDMVGLEVVKLMEDNDVGNDTHVVKLRDELQRLAQHLQHRTASAQPLIKQTDLDAATRQQGCLGWDGAALLQLAMRVGLEETMGALAKLFIQDAHVRQQLLVAFHDEVAADLQRRGDGEWQRFAAVLLQQVPWTALQEQVLPGLAADSSTECSAEWNGPALVSPKVQVMLARLWDGMQERKAGGWSAMLFVKERLSAVVLSHLINSLPALRSSPPGGQPVLRSSEFVGAVQMDQKTQRKVMERFRAGIDADDGLNVLVATNVGSEGMDFRQCCLVLALDQPQTVTDFIQCRGRARAAGSFYELMVNQDEEPGKEACCEDLQRMAEQLQTAARQMSDKNRERIGKSGQGAGMAQGSRRQQAEALITDAGACVTMRLAQPFLAEYCAKLPGTEGFTLLQPYYHTKQFGTQFFSTVYLPSNSGLADPVKGSLQSSISAARQSAALSALQQLHDMGQLNDHLQPKWGSPQLQQIKCRPCQPFDAIRVLPSVLQPRVLPAHAGDNAAGPASPVTMQLHAFRVHMPQQQQLRQQQMPGSSAVATAMLHESAPLQARSSISAAAISSSMPFGVLLPERLPDDLPAFGAWMPGCEGQQCMVTVQHAGTVELQPSQLSALAAYQQVLEKHITLPNVLRRRKRKASSRPFTASHCVGEFGFAFCKLQLALGWQQLGKQQQQQQESGSAFAYHIVPLTSSSSSNGAVFDWGAVQAMAAGPVPALQLVETANNSSDSTSSIRPAVTVYQATAAAAAAASTPRASAHMAAAGTKLVGPAAVHAAAAQLQDRVLISQHSYEPWHCTGISSIACGQPTNWLPQGMSHQQLYETKHGYTGMRNGLPQLRQDLPLLEVRGGRGIKQETCLKKASEPEAANTAAPQVAADAAAPEAAADAGSSQHVGKHAYLHPSAAGSASLGLVHQQHDNMHHQQHVHQLDSPAANAAEGAKQGPCLPLELCWVLPLPSSSWAQLALMPSLMYRLEGLLRLQMFQQQLPPTVVMPPPGLLLTALTPKYAREDFNFERLEFLGDACLKYLAANYVLQSMPTATEGQLSETKAQRVCNMHLASRADESLCASGEPLAAFLRLFPYDKATCTPSAMAQPLRKDERKGKCKADFIEALIGAFYLAAAAQGNDSSMDVDGAASSQVSQAGLEAAAQLCETLGVLPLGSASTAATAPIWPQQQRPSPARLNKAQRLAAELRPVLGGYKFRRPALLQQALTHVSMLGAPSYQRLELLGDAVLDVLVSMQLLLTGSRTLGPGQLTVLRSGRVMNQELAKQATKAGLHKHVDAQARSLPWLKQLTGTIAAEAAASLEQQQARSSVQSAQQEATTAALMAAAETAAVRADDPIWKEVWEMDRGEEVDGEESMKQHKFKILADIVESVTAAVFVDSGGDWEATWAAMRGIVDVGGLAEGSAAEVRRMREAQGPGNSVAELGDDEGEETADEAGTEFEDEDEEEDE